jgi:hypothetical protein
MESNNQYQTLSEASKALSKRGFANPLTIHSANQAELNNKMYSADELKILEYHRFEGMSNPADSSIIYALASKESDEKGILIQSYGAETAHDLAEFIKKVEIENE